MRAVDQQDAGYSYSLEEVAVMRVLLPGAHTHQVSVLI
jgi:hypothetical protein